MIRLNVNEAYKKRFLYKKIQTYASGPVPRLGYNCTKGGFNYHNNYLNNSKSTVLISVHIISFVNKSSIYPDWALF